MKDQGNPSTHSSIGAVTWSEKEGLGPVQRRDLAPSPFSEMLSTKQSWVQHFSLDGLSDSFHQVHPTPKRVIGSSLIVAFKPCGFA